MRPADYHLPEGFKTTEAITQSWDMLKKHWKSFQEAKEQLADTETGTSMTNERWLLPLFRELDYGRLTTETAPVIEERTYPIERFYNNTPIHLIGWNLTLDRRTKGARGAATSSPHSMVQEYLNRSEAHLWAFVSNGRQLRLLRDNVALSRQAYVEFDLEAMMEGEVYSDFALLWMLCHQSRVEAEKTEDCWLEKWSKLAREDGTRVLNNLRTGVANAIEALGRGFLAHPRNDELRRKLQESGSLSKDDFYRQLLRIVYRLLFLFVAEDRELLHPSDVDEKARDLYRKYYSTSRLRDMSLKLRGSKHGDLWHSLSLVFAALGKNDGCPQLGLVGLGSFLWNEKSVADLAGPHEVIGDAIAVQIANDDLLTAIRALAYVEQDRVLRSVDYRNLGSEELGSVYESLLELNPDMQVEARHFELRTAAGNERKTSGSYYTPDSLVQCLLDSALDPVVETRLKGKKSEAAEDAILSMTICDPACGSGHFLIAAAHRLARHLARVRTGDSEPSPEDHQHALRDVIGRCIYGVDINPMAVELCKVSLWIEAIEPGKPLSFLEHHIQCGNSLLGTTPRLLAEGIPDDTFKPIQGDIKAIVSELKKRNKAERRERKQGQRYLFGAQENLDVLRERLRELAAVDDESVAVIAQKEDQYKELIHGQDYRNAKLAADTWCAAFVWNKDDSEIKKLCPTDRDLRDIEENSASASEDFTAEVTHIAEKYQFFHWHVAFGNVFTAPKEKTAADNPEMGWNGGFDVMVGNPPWERVKLQEKEWFAQRVPEIANAPNAAARKRLIKKLKVDEPEIWNDFLADSRQAEGASHLLRDSGLYPLCGRGDVNLYTVFAELFRNRLIGQGRFGAVLPSGIATDDTTKFYFGDLIETRSLDSFYDFENKNIFPEVHSSLKFCLLTAGSGLQPTAGVADFAFFCHAVSDLRESGKRFQLAPEDIQLLNPNTRTCPIFRSTSDAELTKTIYQRIPVLIRDARDGIPEQNNWGITFNRMFDMANDSQLFQTKEQLEGQGYTLDGNVFRKNSDAFVPLYEAKMVNHFDHRAAGVVLSATAVTRQGQSQKLSPREHESPTTYPLPRYWVRSTEVDRKLRDKDGATWLHGWRDITASTNSRTVVSATIPRYAVGDKFLLMLPCEQLDAICLPAITGSFVFDFCARQKIGGISLKYFTFKQLPFISPAMLLPRWMPWIKPRVLELTYTAWDLNAFARDCGYDGPPFRWDEERRFRLRCELDAAFFHLYLGPPSEWGSASPELREMFPSPRDAVDYIMETFPIVKRKDIKRTELLTDAGEVVQEGTYLTKDTILSIYDEMQRAIDTDQSYQTRLDPPPGPPLDVDGNVVPFGQWDEANWPNNIHKP